MPIATILDHDITPQIAEMVYRKAMEWSRATPPEIAKADKGMRAVQARDVRVMTGLERIVKVIDKLEEHQNGRTRRDSGTDFNRRFELVELQIWKKAYESALADTPDPAFAYLYAATTYFVGYTQI